VALRRRAQPSCECRLQARTGGPHAGGDDVVTRASVSDDGGELRQVEQCEGPPPGARTLSATKSRTSENIVRAAGRRHSHPVASDDDSPLALLLEPSVVSLLLGSLYVYGTLDQAMHP